MRPLFDDQGALELADEEVWPGAAWRPSGDVAAAKTAAAAAQLSPVSGSLQLKLPGGAGPPAAGGGRRLFLASLRNTFVRALCSIYYMIGVPWCCKWRNCAASSFCAASASRACDVALQASSPLRVVDGILSLIPTQAL